MVGHKLAEIQRELGMLEMATDLSSLPPAEATGRMDDLAGFEAARAAEVPPPCLGVRRAASEPRSIVCPSLFWLDSPKKASYWAGKILFVCPKKRMAG